MFCTNCGARLDAHGACPYCTAPVPLTTVRPSEARAASRRPSALIILGVVCGALLLALGITVGVLVTRGSDGAPSAARSRVPSTAPTASGSTGASSVATSGAADFAAVFATTRSGVVRIDVVGCTESGVGSGFLLSPTLVATVAHVVDESVVVSLSTDGQRTTGQVIGLDAEHDLALVRAASPLTGHTFRFADRAARIGERVAAIGFPIGDPITLTQGGISGADRTVTVDDVSRSGLLETDAAVNPGNSGGPLLAADGSVLGLVDALNTQANGIAYAVTADQARTATDGWRAQPVSQPPATCDTPLGPDQTPVDLSTIPGLDADAASGIRQTLAAYFGGINSGDYDAAYFALSPAKRAGYTSEQFARGLTSSYDSDFSILTARQVSSSVAKVALQFTSLQAPEQGPDGDTCDVWTLVYRMVLDSSGSWLIDDTSPYRGSTHTSCD